MRGSGEAAPVRKLTDQAAADPQPSCMRGSGEAAAPVRKLTDQAAADSRPSCACGSG